MLAVIGTTATAVFADEPDDAAPQIVVQLQTSPAEVLTGDDLEAFSNLTSESRQILLAALPEVLLQLRSALSEGGLSEDAFPVEERALAAFLTRHYKESQDGLEAAMQALSSTEQDGFAKWTVRSTQSSSSDWTSCYYNTSLYGSYSLSWVTGYQSSRCGADMASITAAMWLTGPGYSSGWRESRRTDASSVSKSVVKYYGSGITGTCWDAWGSGRAEPQPNGPSPSPGTGDSQVGRCF